MIDLNVPNLERNSVFSGLLLVISLNLVLCPASLLYSVYSSFSSIEVCLPPERQRSDRNPTDKQVSEQPEQEQGEVNGNSSRGP
jgi:hypothetical protein